MKRAGLKALLLLAIVILSGSAVIAFHSTSPSLRPSLIVFCAARLKNPCEQAAADFRHENLGEIQFKFGDTATLLSQIRVANTGDLYIAADQGALDDARKHGVIREVIPIVVQHPVIAVRAGNPLKIRSLGDLSRKDIKVALANPDSASVGKRAQTAFGKHWELFSKHITMMKPTDAEIANDLSVGTVDAAIVWNSTVRQFKNLESIEIPELSAKKDIASVAVLASAKDPAAALRFARFLAAPERGNTIFEERGFNAPKGDSWTAEPTLVLYSGGVNRLAIEALLTKFAVREGIKITTVFNGCGVLCATMKARSSTLPDAYYACDLCFIPPVAEHFPEVTLLTEASIGLVVKKGNPAGINRLQDLARPGLRIGLCNAEQSTLGYMTTGILRDLKLREAIQKNVVVEVPTADFLINQMRAGGLDAAIVYSVNAIPQNDHLDFIRIDHKGALAIQPFAIGVHSPRRQLAQRLLLSLKENRAEFEKAGFIWRGDEKTMKSTDIEIPEWLKVK